MKLEWRDSGGEYTAHIPLTDERRLELRVYELAYPYTGMCEISGDVYRNRDYIGQVISVKVKLTIGRAKQRAAKLTEILAPVI